MTEANLTLGLVAIPVLTFLNSAFVAAEIALVSVRRTELEELAASGHAAARAARTAVGQLDRSIAAIQLAITTIGLLLGWFGESNVADALAPRFAELFPSSYGFVSHAVSGVLVLVALTWFQVVLGELAPKAIALQYPRRVALLVARPLLLFSAALAPAIHVLHGSAKLVLRVLRVRPYQPAARAHSLAELAMLVDETQAAGILKPDQADVLRNVFRFGKKTVREAMLPLERTDMIDLRWTPDATLDIVVESAHTRLPVHDGDRANVVGVVNVKDLFHLYRLRRVVNVADVMRRPYFVTPATGLEDQLRAFKRDRVHLGVVKEGDRVLGIVTLEDVLEEIVGEIEDEHDRPRGGAK